MNDRQRLEAIVSVVCKYLPPDGISKDQALNEIISLVDPLPPQRKPLTDEQIQDVVNNAVRTETLSWLGYKKDNDDKYTIPVLSPSDYQFARAIEAAHGIKE